MTLIAAILIITAGLAHIFREPRTQRTFKHAQDAQHRGVLTRPMQEEE